MWPLHPHASDAGRPAISGRSKLAAPTSCHRVLLMLAVGAGVALQSASASAAAAASNRPVCPGPAAVGFARCHARVVTDSRGNPLTTAAPSGYGPADFHTAYALPATAPTAQTIAIVDAYDDPSIESDLAVYDATFGLPACTVANGCLRKLNQSGAAGPYPPVDAGWALEISVDVETAHAICESCQIMLVEASSSSLSDLATAENLAAALGATEISNSYGGREFSGETAETAFDHPGIAITASAGDSGFGTEFPAAAPTVVAVGGTTLNLLAGSAYGSETVWSGTGSGCSLYALAPTWQTADPNWSRTGCVNKRGIADVAADADPATGAAVYDSTPYLGHSGWFKVGGTSLSAPLIAAVFALGGSAGRVSYPGSLPYANRARLHDVTSGSNGTCGTIMCSATSGYDGPTGVGTPNGVGGFQLAGSSADLSVSGTAAPSPVVADGTLTYTIRVANAGPSDATGVVATDSLPSTSIPGSATSSQGSCVLGRTVSCTLGTLPAGSSATLIVTTTPLQPGTITNSVSVSASESDPTSGNNTSAQRTVVSPQSNTAYVSVSDFSFTPQGVTVAQGSQVQWNFYGPSVHSATDASGMALFDSGPMSPVSYYRFGFFAAGRYPYVSAPDGTLMTGNVKVPLIVAPGAGATSTTFMITCASASPPSGYVFDVQISRPGGTGFVDWRKGVVTTSSAFVADAGPGTYGFRARLRRLSNAAHSRWSSAASVSVT